MEKTQIFPIDTATCRDILEAADPDHALHTCDGATISKASIEMLCTCGSVVVFTADEAESKGWKLGDVASRLKKLGQTGRKQ
jgi:hypothetical protein